MELICAKHTGEFKADENQNKDVRWDRNISEIKGRNFQSSLRKTQGKEFFFIFVKVEDC